MADAYTDGRLGYRNSGGGGYPAETAPILTKAESSATIEEGVDRTFLSSVELLEFLKAINMRLKNQNQGAEKNPSGPTPIFTIVDKAYLTNNLVNESRREVEEIARQIFR